MSITSDFWKAMNESGTKVSGGSSSGGSSQKSSGGSSQSNSGGSSGGSYIAPTSTQKKKKKSISEEFWEAMGDDDIAPVSSVASRVQARTTGGRFNADLAPVAKSGSKKDKDKGKVFQKGLFEDGYNIGDITKTILGTAGDVAIGAAKGFTSGVEGIIDLGSYGVAGILDAVGKDDDADRLRRTTAESQTDQLWGGLEATAEKYSVLGEKADSVIDPITQALGYIGMMYATAGIGAAAGVSGAGATALSTGTMFASSAGGSMGEAYQGGATDEEALKHGVMKGAVDAGSELIFGGLGKAAKTLGLSRGLSSLDDIFAKKLSDKISNHFWKNAVEYGVKASAEGVEEVLAGLGSAVSKKLTYMSDEDLSKLIEDENLLEQFAVGTAASAIMQSGFVPGTSEGSLKESITTGRDFISGLSQNEQKVVDKLYQDEIASREKNGKVTQKEKDKIYDSILKDMERGYISTDIIEEVLGGESYSAYRDTVDSEDAILQEYEELGEKPNATPKDYARYTELTQKVKDIHSNSHRNALRAKLNEEVMGLVKGDRLAESYNEKTRRGQAFEADLSKYDAKQQATIQKAIDSGILNNTNRTHEFVDIISKISADKGVLFDFTNNTKLKESGFAVDGRQVNGFVTKDGISLNIDSPQAWQKTVGHEVTHVLEGTEFYTELQNTLFEYAKTKGEYDSRMKSLTELYKDVQDADINAELTADLVGEYLFTDENFIKNLSTQNRNVFQKIYDEIKYLCKVATGSKEAKELERVKRAFDKAYKEAGNGLSDTKYSISSEGKELTKEQQEFFKDSKVRDENGSLKVMYHGTPNGDFTVFKDGTYFTDNKEYADKYQNPGASSISTGKEAKNPKTFEVYLDIKKPFDINDAEARNIYINDYIKGGNAMGINPYLSDAEYDKIQTIDWTEGEDLREFLIENEYDYDGLVLDEGGTGGYGDEVQSRGKSYVVFSPEQVKNIDNQNPTSNTDIRFSLSESVEETKDLMALHNLTEQKLLKSLQLGGLPMPSVAIAKAKDGYSEFGEISLILPRETIDPETSSRNKLYSGDAWTPTYPKVEYKLNSKALKQVRDKINGLVPANIQEFGRLHLDSDNMEDTLNRYNGDMVDAFKDNDALKYAYLMEAEADVQLPMKEKNLSYSGSRENGAIIKVAEAISSEDISKALNGGHEEVQKLEPIVRKAVAEYVRETYGDDQFILDTFAPAEGLSFSDLDGYLVEARKYHRNGIEQTVDTRPARELIRDMTVQYSYEEWLKNLFSGIVEKEGIRNNKDYFTPSGNRRSFEALHYEHNLENVIKAMREKGEKGIGFGGGSIFGAATTEFSSVDEMKQASGRLQQMSEEEYQEIKDGFTKRFFDLASSLPNDKKSFIATDDAANTLTEAVAKYQTRSGMANYLRRELKGWATYSPQVVDDLIELVNDIRSMPTGYFEAKPQRAVSFEEVGVFVIPYDADVKLKQELLNKGYSIAEYDPKVEGDRTRVLNQFEEYKFSLSNNGEQFGKTGRFATPATELRLTTEDSKDVAPVAENATVQEKTQLTEENSTDVTAADMQALFPDDAVPVQEELERLEAHRKQLYGALEDAVNHGSANDVGKLAEEYEEVNSRIKELEQEEAERTGSITDAPPEMDAPFYGDSENVTVDNPFEERDWYKVGNQKVKAYMYENPEVKPFFQEEALNLLGELSDTQKGERIYNDQVYYDSGGEKGWQGVKRFTSESIETLLDGWGMSYADIEKGLNAIIKDNGAENIAAAKKIEFMLNDRLLNGYKDFYSSGRIEPNQDYINLLNEKQINSYSKEAFDSFMQNADLYAPMDDVAPTKPLEKATPDTMDAPVYESKEPGAVKGQTTMFEPEKPKTSGRVAKVLTEEAKVAKEKSGIGSKIVAALVDKGAVVEKLSHETGNHELQAKYQAALPSTTEAKAQYFMEKGAEGVKSLKDIKKEVDRTGKTEDFFNYLYHRHNVDRMSLDARFGVENKPVYGDSVTSEKSSGIVKRLERANPEFRDMAENIYAYNKHLRKLLVDGNVISQETADLWEKMYPHYVPIRRVDDTGVNINVALDTNKTGVNAPVKRATGGSSDIQPLFETMAMRTEQTYRAIARNSFGLELKNTLGSVIENDAGANVGVDEMIDTIEMQDDLLKPGTMASNPTFTVFENGERVEFEINEDLYDALKPAGKVLGHRSKAVTSVSEWRRNLLTTWNPVFALYRNPIKDIQDVGVNSQHPVKTYANVPNAIYQIATGGKWATEYAKNGGKSNTYFDSRTNKFKAEDNVFKKTIGMPLKAFENAGEFIEEIPRLAEYIASRKDGRSVERSMLDAARVTTNFAAGGDFTKFLNSHGFTFLNASVQGAAQHVRNFREAKQQGLKGYVKVLAKYTAAGLPGILLNNLLWDEDEEYEELNDYVKQNYYVVAKTEDGKFIRIPKGRTAAVMQNAFEQMEHLVTGDDEADFGTFFELFMNNIAPNNPIENNILAPIGQALNNKAWYGGDLVPSRLQKLPAEEQFDESTDAFSKWLGENTGTSPYKWNYLIDQYSGGLGDVFLPMFTPEAESGDNSFKGNIIAPWKKEITTDSVLNNRNPGDFYELRDELEVKSNAKDATDEDKMRNMYMDSVGWEMSDLYAKKREIQNSDLPDDEKYEAVREVQEQINEMAKNALGSYNDINIDGKYATVGDKRFDYSDYNGKWYEIEGEYLEKEQNAVKRYGITPSDYWNNTDLYYWADRYFDDKYADNDREYIVNTVFGGKRFAPYAAQLSKIKGEDKDGDGKTDSGSKKDNIIDYINGLDIDYGERLIMYRTLYSSKADKKAYNQEIIDYLNERDDIDYQGMKTILEELDFKVDSEGYISW